jgi:hypothetical protein
MLERVAVLLVCEAISRYWIRYVECVRAHCLQTAFRDSYFMNLHAARVDLSRSICYSFHFRVLAGLFPHPNWRLQDHPLSVFPTLTESARPNVREIFLIFIDKFCILHCQNFNVDVYISRVATIFAVTTCDDLSSFYENNLTMTSSVEACSPALLTWARWQWHLKVTWNCNEESVYFSNTSGCCNIELIFIIWTDWISVFHPHHSVVTG